MLFFKRQKLIIVLLVVFIVNIFMANQILAFDRPASGYLDNLASQPGIKIKTTKSLPQVVGGAVNYAVGFLGIIFLLLILYAGFLWMTAGGDQEDVRKAGAILKWSIIGAIVILGAYSVTYYVVKNTQQAVKPIVNPEVPVGDEEDEMLGPVDTCSSINCSDYDGDYDKCESFKDKDGNTCCTYEDGLERCY